MIEPIIYAVTVNWNQPALTLACLETLRRQQGVKLNLVVVDNGSADHLKSYLSSIQDAYIIETDKNIGFAGGYNKGLRYCLEQGAEQILIINNDTLAAPNMVWELASSMKLGVAASGPVIRYYTHPDLIWSQGDQFNTITFELENKHSRNIPVPDSITPRQFLSGCCLLISRTAIETIGLFDENFFLYYEDQDWCMRCWKKGLNLLLVPNANLTHHVSYSSQGSDSVNERYWMARSSVYFFRKHVTGFRWAAVLPWRLGSALRTSFRLLHKRSYLALSAYWRGLFDGLRFKSNVE